MAPTFKFENSGFLSKHVLTLTRESTWSDDPTPQIQIQRTEKGRFIASYTIHKETNGFRSICSRKISRSVSETFITDIMSSLATIKIPPFPKPKHGNDGAFTILELGDYWGAASFRWWGSAPKEWEPLRQIATKIWELFPIE